jgi:hypothetical protein
MPRLTHRSPQSRHHYFNREPPARYSVRRLRPPIPVRPGNGLIGQHWHFRQWTPTRYESAGVAFPAFWFFQSALAAPMHYRSPRAPERPRVVRRRSARLRFPLFQILGHRSWGPNGLLATRGVPNGLLPLVGTPLTGNEACPEPIQRLTLATYA